MGERASLARLAQAGDHVDFVVTLLSAADETVGRVERQTAGGTVAIRELRDASCARVADALALSLALSLQPKDEGAAALEPDAADAAVVPDDAARETPATAPAIGAGVRPKPAESAALRAQARAEPSSPPINAAHEKRAPDGRWLGLAAGALTGAAPRALVRAAASLSFEDVAPGVVSGAALRFGPIFAFGSSPTVVGSVERWVLAGRAEGCPLRWGNPALGVLPCLSVELGATHASQSDAAERGQSNLWLATGVGLRGALRLASGVNLDGQVEAQLPLFKNDVTLGSRTIYRQEILGFQGSLGISARLW